MFVHLCALQQRVAGNKKNAGPSELFNTLISLMCKLCLVTCVGLFMQVFQCVYFLGDTLYKYAVLCRFIRYN